MSTDLLPPGLEALPDPRWLAALSTEQVATDGAVMTLRAHSPAGSRRWLVARAAVPGEPAVTARLRRTFALRHLLSPDWAVLPLHLVPTLDGPVLLLRDDGGGPPEGAAQGIAGFLRLAAGAAQALGLAHAVGLLHHDLTPASLFEGADGTIRLTGFGLALVQGYAFLAGESGLGSPAFTPPERARRADPVSDTRSDLYALGMTLYALLAGRLLFEEKNTLGWMHAHAARRPPPPSRFRAEVPGMLDTILLKLLEKEPERRYRSAAALERDLRRCLFSWERNGFVEAFEPGEADGHDPIPAAPAQGVLASRPSPRRIITRPRAECLILEGRFPEAAAEIACLIQHATGQAERLAALRLDIRLRSLQSDFAGALRTGREALPLLGIQVPAVAGPDDLDATYCRLRAEMGARGPAALPGLAPMTDPLLQEGMELLASLVAPANFVDDALMLILLCEQVRLTVLHGLAPASAQGIAWFGVALAHHFGEYGRGVEFAEAGVRIAEASGGAEARSATLVALDQVSAWSRPFDFALGCARAALAEGRDGGDGAMACYACNHIVSDLLVMGVPLAQVEEEIGRGLAFARQAHFADVQAILGLQRGFVAVLRGTGTLPAPPPHTAMTPLLCWHMMFRGVIAFTEDDPDEAERCLDHALALAWSTPAHIHVMCIHLFAGLVRAARGDAAGLAPHLAKMRGWAELNPGNFRDKALLLEAEEARLEGNTLRALSLYEEAVAAATAADRPQVRAIAHERAAACYVAHGLEGAARHHLRDAQAQYEAWGAARRAARLSARHSFLPAPRAARREGQISPQSHDGLDLLAAMAAVQSLSGEIDTNRLVERLLGQAMAVAGASRAALVLTGGGRTVLEALGTVQDEVSCDGTRDEDRIAVRFARGAPSARDLPLSVLYSVIQRHAAVSIPDLRGPHEHAFDGYFGTRPARSLLALPLIKQGTLIGVLHLENEFAAHAFDSSRQVLLEVIASQAAISLENARLYAALRTSEAFLTLSQRISRSGSFRWNRTRDEHSWSEGLFHLWGADPSGGPLSLDEMRARTHPEDRARIDAVSQQPWGGGVNGPHAFRILDPAAPEGTYRHVELMFGSAEPDVFVGVLTDVTERRATEAALRGARTELAQAAQAATMGELAASIAHEINQPLSTIVAQAGAVARWLGRPEPEIGEALAGLADIVQDGQRASDIVRSLRSLARQAPPDRRAVAMDALVRRVAGLVAAEVELKGTVVQQELAAPHATVLADPVQLEQVFLNLILNAAEAVGAMPEGPRRVAIASRHDAAAGAAVFTVDDTGPGIAAADLARIFDPFFTTKPTGLGMGLPICRSIVEAHGGWLECVSTGPSGSRFLLRLPAAA
ncbi:ATP-binding sensor histidine kinase [Pararoseomonas indoligenes]|uniref:histidine kinase n=1 Tax=Roseomonas indoligenes TaxID=2820811 RepID=A0A940N489_9PROT|nr:ATP-binding sensor histidine kinase [Pararoseomonas indoligenes]MBP0496397.1 GAF domain-containing protein [Pararoseomonas indoligenes]